MRELVQRGVLTGEHGGYDVSTRTSPKSRVPATVQAAIEARIDRLGTLAKRDVERGVGDRRPLRARNCSSRSASIAVFDELLGAELIDQVRFTPNAEYAFRHPLIRAVAYESQLKSDRAESHRRLAAAIQERDPASAEENAALDRRTSTGRRRPARRLRLAHARRRLGDQPRHRSAARLSWDRARTIADALPDEDPDQLPMRIAPRTMLCVTDWRVRRAEELGGGSQNCGSCAARPATRRHWPSAWPGW